MSFGKNLLVAALFFAAGIGYGEDVVTDAAEQWRDFRGTGTGTAGGRGVLRLETEKLGGRTALFFDPYVRCFKHLPEDDFVRYAKTLGATDIIMTAVYPGGGKGVFGYVNGPLPPHCFGDTSNGAVLRRTAEACERHGLKLWLMCHGFEERRLSDPKILADHKAFYAYDKNGNIYSQSERADLGGDLDIVSDKTLALLDSQVAFLKSQLKDFPCFQGFFLDEFWFNYMTNFFQPYFARFADWCDKEYGERPGPEIEKKIGERGKWHDLNDKWWRRYVVWRETVIDGFEKNVETIAHKYGLKIINQRVRRGYFDRDYAWRFGQGVHNLTIGDWVATGCGQNAFDWEKSARIVWCFGDQARNQAEAITGRPTLAFTSWPLLLRDPKMSERLKNSPWNDPAEKYGYAFYLDTINRRNVPATIADDWRILFRNSRRWQGGTPMADTAVLMTDRGNVFEARVPSATYEANEKTLFDAYRFRRPAVRLDVEFPKRFADYRVLVFSGPALKYLSEKAYGDLTDFIRNGGLLIGVQPRVRVSLSDGSKAVDKTAELFGGTMSDTPFQAETIEFGDDAPILPGLKLRTWRPEGRAFATTDEAARIVAWMKNAKASHPAIVTRKLGKGMTVGVYFDLPRTLADETKGNGSMVFIDLLETLTRRFAASPPSVTLTGDATLVGCVKKNDDIGLSFYSEKPLPIFGRVKISADSLDGEKFSVTERSGGFPEPIVAPSGAAEWKAFELTALGAPVRVRENRGYALLEIQKIK